MPSASFNLQSLQLFCNRSQCWPPSYLLIPSFPLDFKILHYHGSHILSLTAPSLSSWLATLLPPASQVSSSVHFICCVSFALYILCMGNCTHCCRFSWHANSEYTGDLHVYYSSPYVLPKSQSHNHNSQLTFTTLSISKTPCLERNIFPHHKSTPPPKYAIYLIVPKLPFAKGWNFGVILPSLSVLMLHLAWVFNVLKFSCHNISTIYPSLTVPIANTLMQTTINSFLGCANDLLNGMPASSP